MSARRKSSVNLQAPASKVKATQMNFNIKNETLRNESRGTKPTTNPTSVREVLTTMVLFMCKKTIFFDIRLKVGLYLLSLFIISLIGGNMENIFGL